MDKLKSVENVSNQGVNHCIGGVNVSKGLFGRYISKERIFDLINIDDITYYEFKSFGDNIFWRDDKTLANLYKYNSCFMGFYFRNNKLPKRCENPHKELVKTFTDWLKGNGKSRVSNLKVKLVVKHILKHISRLHYHNKFTLVYTRDHKNWKEYKNLSHEYSMLFLDYLVEEGVAKSFTGYSSGLDESSNRTSSMLVVKPDFIHLCNGKVCSKAGMDDCLKTIEANKPLVKIHERYGSSSKLKREKVLTKEEKIVAKDLSDMMGGWLGLLHKSMIEVNGTLVPEIFFVRIFNDDFNHGGRFFDDGSIQQQSKPIRDTIKIDGEDTVELDFKSLHYAFAAEELGLNLLDKDPYAFDYDIVVCQDSIDEWEKQLGIKYYQDPVRNIKKLALLVMFNASSVESAIGGISKTLLDDYKKDKAKRRFVGIKGLKVKELIRAVVDHNEEVKDYFMSGVGTRFQNLDSNIMDYCVREFVKVNQVCLPVHDSLIVKKSLATFTTKCMEDGFESVMGSKINCRVE